MAVENEDCAESRNGLFSVVGAGDEKLELSSYHFMS
jgi:hypothetical protein